MTIPRSGLAFPSDFAREPTRFVDFNGNPGCAGPVQHRAAPGVDVDVEAVRLLVVQPAVDVPVVVDIPAAQADVNNSGFIKGT